MLLWDAILLAAGVGSSVLSRFIDSAQVKTIITAPQLLINYSVHLILSCKFNFIRQWMQTSIGPLTSALFSSEFAGSVVLSEGDHEVGHIMRRRVLWLISCWSYHISSDMLPGILQLLTAVLAQVEHGGDVVTMIQAIDTLKAITETESFRASMIEGVFPALVRSMCHLTTRLEESEFQARVVDLIADLVLLMGVRVRPVLQPITTHLCALWTAAGDEAPVKGPVLSALGKLVRSAGMASDGLHSVLLPLIASVFSDNELAFLVPDACVLWQALVRDAAVYSASMDTILKLAIPILLQNDDFQIHESPLLKSLMLILESYAVVGGQQVIVLALLTNYAIYIFTLVIIFFASLLYSTLL